MRWCNVAAFAAALILIQAAAFASPKDRPPEIPKHLEAVAPKQNFASAQTVSIAITSREARYPATPQRLEHCRRAVLKTLQKIPLTVVGDRTPSELSLEFIFEPHVWYGMYHSQYAPYVYLTLRQAPSERLVYCAYQRLAHFHSGTDRLLQNFEYLVQHPGVSRPGSLDECAKEAMRPL